MAEISRKVCTNSFLNGMNKDTDDAYLEQTKYRHAENLRILSDKNDQLGSINNIKGNVKSIDKDLLWTSNVYKVHRTSFYTAYIIIKINGSLQWQQSQSIVATNYDDFYSKLGKFITDSYPLFDLQTSYTRDGLYVYSSNKTYKDFTFECFEYPVNTTNNLITTKILDSQDSLIVIGDTFIRDEIFLFTCPKINTQRSGQIWKVTYNSTLTEVPIPTIELLYNNILNFDHNTPIRGAKGSFENEECKKIYFTDNNNYLRSFNTADINCFAVAPGVVDVVGDVNLTKPILYDIGTGSLSCGTIYYCYRLYNKYNSESNFSPSSGPIPLGIGSITSNNDYSFKGGAGNVSSGKSVTIKIDNIDTRYQYMQIFSALYIDGTSSPEITKVSDILITQDSILFTDDGTTPLAAISEDEASIYAKIAFVCKTIETKNNLLLAGNIEENIFDVEYDARAYGFRYQSNLSQIVDVETGTISSIPNDFNIDQKHDAKNQNPHSFKFKKNSSILGGTGLNVSYEIKCLPIQIGSIAGDSGVVQPDYPYDLLTLAEGSQYEDWTNWLGDSSFTDNKGSFTGYASPFNVNQFKGYKRGETYRFGIVFLSKKGERSSVKWIGDILMPEATDTSHVPLHSAHIGPIFDFRTFFTKDDGSMYGVILHLDFDINIPEDIKDQISGFEIVRVDRDGKNRTKISQGFLGPTTNFANNAFLDACYVQTMHSGFISNNIASFSCPEGIFDKNIEYKSGDSLHYFGQAVGIHQNTLVKYAYPHGCTVHAYKNLTPFHSPHVVELSDSLTTLASLYHEYRISAGGMSLQKYFNIEKLNTADEADALGGTKNVIAVEPPNSLFLSQYLPADGPYPCGILVDYNRILENQYGGAKYSDRVLNTYISTHTYMQTSTDGIYKVKVFGGDIYINIFDSQRLIWLLSNEDNNGGIFSECVAIPVESTINLAYRSDAGYIKTRNGRLQEVATHYVPEASTTMPEYSQDYDLYQYNPAYSKANNIQLFFAENKYVIKQKKFDCRIHASKRKTPNNFVDDWTKFPINTKIDINTSCGPITKLVNLKNVIYGIQDNGFGVASIDDRAVVQSLDSTKIVLGTSEVLPRYDYISLSAGSRHQFSIIQSETAIYFYDASDRQLKVFMGQDGSLSDGFGLKAFMHDNTSGFILSQDNPHANAGINGYFDERFNEVVFTFHKSRSSKDYFTLAFNETLKCFTGFYTFRAPIYIKHYNHILSPLRVNDGDSLYLHNFGDYNTFYDAKHISKLHFISNESYGTVKVFDNITVECEITEDDVNILNDFYTKIRCYNNYQNTDWNDLIYDDSVATGKEVNFSRRERLFKLQIPRNIVDSDITNNPDIFDPVVLSNANREFRERMRDKLLHVELIYSNPNNRKFKSSALSTTYRISAR